VLSPAQEPACCMTDTKVGQDVIMRPIGNRPRWTEARALSSRLPVGCPSALHVATRRSSSVEEIDMLLRLTRT
jgi:hypothetical protein